MFEKHIAYFVNESDAIDFCTIKNKSIAYKEDTQRAGVPQ
jgi:hypothetical protein